MSDADVKNKKTSNTIKTETVGDRLKVIRKSLGLKQYDFAKKIGSVQSTVSCVERNIRPILPEMLNKLRDMGYSTEWILYGTPNSNFTSKKFNNLMQLIGESGIHIENKEALEVAKMLDGLTVDQLLYLKGIIIGLKAANGAGSVEHKES